jgi:hypothetical protein
MPQGGAYPKGNSHERSASSFFSAFIANLCPSSSVCESWKVRPSGCASQISVYYYFCCYISINKQKGTILIRVPLSNRRQQIATLSPGAGKRATDYINALYIYRESVIYFCLELYRHEKRWLDSIQAPHWALMHQHPQTQYRDGVSVLASTSCAASQACSSGTKKYLL